MWVAERQDIDPPAGMKITIAAAGRTLSFGDVVAGWRSDEAFREFFIAELAALPFAAFFWEMPPLWQGRLDFDYEYVATGSDELARLRPSSEAFAEHLDAASATNSVVSFRNLSGDALLVAPKQMAEPEAYGHIAAFVRGSPLRQRHELLQTLGDAIHRTLQEYDGPVWVSTSGLGVPWVHVRLDKYPKYYNYQAYANG
jgi:hypothetical protein